MIRDAAHWDRLGRESLQSATEPMPWMKFFEPRPGSAILELGCHKGANLLKWASEGHSCHGVDPAASCIAIFYGGKESPPDIVEGGECSAEIGPGEDFDGEHGWDHVVLASVLESVEDPVPLLEAVERSLAPDGEAYITTLSRWYDGKGPNDTQARFYTAEQLAEAVEEAGLYVVRMSDAGPPRKGQYYWICWARHAGETYD